MRIEGYKGITGITQNKSKGRLLRFLFQPPKLGPLPPTWMATDFAGLQFFNRFAQRLAKCPPDLITHLGVVRANAYFDAGCPLELCDHAAARDLWRVIYADVIAPCRSGHHEEGLCH